MSGRWRRQNVAENMMERKEQGLRRHIEMEISIKNQQIASGVVESENFNIEILVKAYKEVHKDDRPYFPHIERAALGHELRAVWWSW